MTQDTPVRYELAESIATITLDDGKANVMSETMSRAILAALDRAERDGAVVVLTGRARIFSGGYDLTLFKRPVEEIARTLRAGGEVVERMFGFPLPIVAACPGHAVAQGAFVLLAADVRIGTAGAFKLGLNEVAIGLTIPHYGVEIARARLTPSWFNHATLTGTLYTPDEAFNAGFLDRVVAPEALLASAREEAARLTKLDMNAHRATKQRVRGSALSAIHEGIRSEYPAS